MPNYDFQCATHGIFEAMSRPLHPGVESQQCPRCGEMAPQVWRRAPAVKNDDIHATRVGGRTFTTDAIEAALAAPDTSDDDSDAFYNQPGFEERFLDTLNEKANLAAYGELPPVAPEDKHSQSVFADAMKNAAKE